MVSPSLMQQCTGISRSSPVRRAQALRRTLDRRPDLIARRGGLSADDEDILGEFTLLDENRQNG